MIAPPQGIFETFTETSRPFNFLYSTSSVQLTKNKLCGKASETASFFYDIKCQSNLRPMFHYQF